MIKRISVQWRITILTALLIAAACVSLNLLLFYSGSGSMDALNGFVVEYKTENQQEMTIQIPKENMQAFFSDFSQQVNEEKVRFERIGWYITALVTLLSAIIAYFFSGKALKPLKDFAQQTEQINEESLTDTRLSEDAGSVRYGCVHVENLLPDFCKRKSSPSILESEPCKAKMVTVSVEFRR